MSYLLQCDFCSSPDVQWSFPCRNFNVDRDFLVAGITSDGTIDTSGVNARFGYDGGWAACPACHALILRDSRDKLARRSAKRFLRLPEAPPMSLANTTRLMRDIQDEFWNHRRPGPPTRLDRRVS